MLGEAAHKKIRKSSRPCFAQQTSQSSCLNELVLIAASVLSDLQFELSELAHFIESVYASNRCTACLKVPAAP